MCHIEAQKYETKKEFLVNSKCFYSASYKYGWLNDICSHMKGLGNRLFRCVYVYEFPDNSAYVGLTYNLTRRNNARKQQSNDAVTKYINETNLQPNLKQLSQYIYVDVAIVLENDIIEFYRDNNWKILNRAMGGAIGSVNKFWTKELCHIEAIKYNTRGEFYFNNNKAYTAAQRYGWLDDICQHMYIKIKHRTVESCRNEALKYETRYEFGLNNKSAYIWAHRKKILNYVCSHMYSAIGNNQYKQKKHD